MDVVIFYKSYCPFSIRAKEILHGHHFKSIKEVKCDDTEVWERVKKDMEKNHNITEQLCTPIILINGVFIGNEKALKRMVQVN